MVLIFIKIILCTSLLLAMYYLFLEKEKMYRFNRFFLLVSLVFSFAAPFISIKTEVPKPTKGSVINIENTAQQVLNLSQKQNNFNWEYLLLGIYALVALILFIKILHSILLIKNIKGKKIFYQNHKVLVTEKPLSPFTFWNTIYLGKNHLINNQIDARVFLHEKSHLQQKHSIDILFIEILKVFMWFNPALYLYKKAIITNHEFLADEAVINSNFNIKNYQELILEEILSGQNYNLTHTLNFNNTKKRFIMMNRKKTKLTSLKKAISIPVLFIVFGLFVQKTYAHIPDAKSTFVSATSEKAEEKKDDILQKTLENTKEILENKSANNTNDEKEIIDTIRPNKEKTVKKEPKPIQNVTSSSVESSPLAENSDTTIPAEPTLGINIFRSEIAQNFNSKSLEKGKGIIKSTAFISIDKEGKITTVSTTGNNEAMNTELGRVILAVSKDMLWKPATKDGQPIDSKFKLPVTMNFE